MDRLNNAYNPKLNTILVTGANGFVGKPLCLALFAQGQAEITGVRVKLNNRGNVNPIKLRLVGRLIMVYYVHQIFRSS